MPRAKSADEIGTLGFALLGLIAREPKSGYDLARHLERPLGDLWTAQLPQIYPELAKLQAAGLVKSRAVTQKSRPDKKIYTITKAGEAALADWVATPVKQTPVRRELMLKTFSVWLADPDRAAALYRAEAEAAEQALARYQEKLGKLADQYGRSGPPADSKDFGIYANLKFASEATEHTIRWCRWLIAQLSRA